MNVVNKSIALTIETKADDNSGTISAYLTTFGNEDKVGDIMAKGSVDAFIKSFNPEVQKLPMLLEHDNASIIGEWTSLKADDHGVLGEGVLYTETTKGSDVYKLMKRGAVSSVSIGFRSNDYVKNASGGKTFGTIQLVETSVVLNPANSQAQLVSVKSEDGFIETAALKKVLMDSGLTKSETEALFMEGWKGLKNLREDDVKQEALMTSLTNFKL
tara:strand:+ start:261 stop:905 length:645 start_codon:yes stop_codon:yes gene_type:complete